MFGSPMLDTIIAMVFVFLTASLAVTAANEFLASLYRWRASDLEAGIRRLLDRMSSAPKPGAAGEAAPAILLPSFKNHALIQSLVKKDGKFPSYISARTFATVLLDLAQIPQQTDKTVAALRTHIKGNAALPQHLKDALDALLGQVEGDVQQGASAVTKLREAVEGWFDGAMDRVAGWYKRRSQFVSLGVAFGLSLALNLDSIEMVQRLSKDSTLRQAMVAQATQVAQSAAKAPDTAAPAASPSAEQATAAAYANLVTQVRATDDLGLPVGWGSQLDRLMARRGLDLALAILGKLLGITLTALAASLGAPFWFDILSRFVNMRGAGKPVEKAVVKVA